MKIAIFILFLCLLCLYIYPFLCYSKITFKKKYTIKHDTKLYTYNSSISKENGDYVVYSRVDNAVDSTKKRETYLGITILDQHFNIKNQYMKSQNRDGNVIEDLRVFFYKNQKYFIGSMYELFLNKTVLNKFRPVILCNDKIIEIVEDNQLLYNNKNLIPFMVNDNLYIIKNHNPLEIIKVIEITDKCYTIPHYKAKYNSLFPKLRGNTLYIPFKENKMIGITHIFNTSFSRNYVHYITVIDITDINHPYIEKISDPLCFTGLCGIEFIMGFIESYDKNSYIVTLGKNDKSCYIVEISKEYVYELLNGKTG